jgi:Uma2 family endonuclease
MAETDLHRLLMIALLHALEEFFRGNPLVYVSGNIFIYYPDEAGVLQSVAPDIFVVFGVAKGERRIYNLAEEGKAPEVVIELTSRSTKVEDLVTKHYIYGRLGVREYFLFDPYCETVQPALTGFRLKGGEYVPITGTRLHSETLGLDLVSEQGLLRLYDPKTGQRLRTPKETEAEFRDALKRLTREFKARQKAEAKATAAQAKAAAAQAKAAQELAARQAAEAKAAEELLKRKALEAELARLQKKLARLNRRKS